MESGAPLLYFFDFDSDLGFMYNYTKNHNDHENNQFIEHCKYDCELMLIQISSVLQFEEFVQSSSKPGNVYYRHLFKVVRSKFDLSEYDKITAFLIKSARRIEELTLTSIAVLLQKYPPCNNVNLVQTQPQYVEPAKFNGPSAKLIKGFKKLADKGFIEPIPDAVLLCHFKCDDTKAKNMMVLPRIKWLRSQETYTQFVNGLASRNKIRNYGKYIMCGMHFSNEDGGDFLYPSQTKLSCSLNNYSDKTLEEILDIFI